LLAVVEPGLGSRCLVWAVRALAATPHGAPWGTSQSWLGWWWREVVAVSLLVAASVWYVVWLRRRRRSTKDHA
jgi:membrane protein DedA with SNARE-associated domain